MSPEQLSEIFNPIHPDHIRSMSNVLTQVLLTHGRDVTNEALKAFIDMIENELKSAVAKL